MSEVYDPTTQPGVLVEDAAPCDCTAFGGVGVSTDTIRPANYAEWHYALRRIGLHPRITKESAEVFPAGGLS